MKMFNENKVVIASILLMTTFLGFSGCIDNSTETHLEIIPHQDLDLDCISFIYEEEDIVITTEEEYQNLLNHKLTGETCDDYVLPTIDFTQEILLGKYTTGDGCIVTFNKTVYKDNASKTIIIQIDVIEEGDCDGLDISMNWMTIPKVSDDFRFEFEVARRSK